MKKILIALNIVQVVDNDKRRKEGLKRLGKGYVRAYRLNPFNPLSYLIAFISIPIMIIMGFYFGFVDMISKTENPFKWN